ncbi:MAG: hypothetical protein ABIP79_17730 [Chitinophagaceae bacterium]
MRILSIIILISISFTVQAQEERDSTLRSCPVFITDTVSSNNFFIEARPAILKVYRVKGKLTIAVEQKGQYVSLYFHAKSLKTGSYSIVPGSRGSKEVEGIYSFRSGDQASYIAISSGKIDVSYDKETDHWVLNLNGMISNLVERTLTYYKVYGKLYLK